MNRRLSLTIIALAMGIPALLSAVPLEVVQRAPEGELNSLEAAKEVVVTFDRPMVALTAGEDSGNFCPCRISPSLAGRCRWRGTNTLAYEFTSVPGPGHTYEVTIPEGTASQVSGEKLGQDVRFSFQTLRPRVTSVYPGDGSDWLGLKPAFFVRFNIPVKAQAAGDYAVLHGPAGVAVPLECVEHTSSELRRDHLKGLFTDVEAYSWLGSNQILEFRPQRALVPHAHYTLSLKQGWPAQGGDAGPDGLAQDSVNGYDTYGEFKAIRVEQYSDCSTRGRLIFSNPVLEEHLERFVTVSPAVPVEAWNGDGPRYNGDDGGSAWRVPLDGWHFAPDTLYHFTIAAGLKDAFGQILKQSAAFDWTSPSLCPGLDAKGGFGVMESYVPAKHPLDATNEDTVTVHFKTVPPEEAVPAYESYGASFDYDSLRPSFEDYKEASWTVPAEPNVQTHSYIDLYKLLGPDLGSFTLLGIQNANNRDLWTIALDNRTDLGITLKSSPETVLVWTTDLRSGAPRPYVPVELRDSDNKILWNGRSDKNGIALAPGWRGLGLDHWRRWEAPRIFALAQSTNGTALLDSQYHEGLDPWRFGLPYGGYQVAQPEQTRQFEVFPDRGVYRPGESVHFKGWVRDLKDGDWALPAGLKSLDLQVMDCRDRQVLTGTANVDSEGGFDFVFTLAADAPTGSWSLSELQSKTAPGAEAYYRWLDGGFSQDFRVEAVKAATYEVNLYGLKPWARLGDSLKATVSGRYLAGAGMPGADGTWSLTVNPTDFSPEGWDGWTFSLPGDAGDYSGWDGDEDDDGDDDSSDGSEPIRLESLAGSGTFKLNAASQAPLTIATKGLQACSPCQAVLEVNLSSPDRQKLFVRDTVLLHEGQAYPGYKTDQPFGEVGKTFPAGLVVLDPAGSTLPGCKLGVSLMRQYTQSVRVVGALGRLEWRSEERAEEAGKWTLKSGAKPLAWNFTPKLPGHYLLLLKAVDADGHAQQAGGYFDVFGAGDAAWRRDDSDMIEMVPDKAKYKVGDTAHVLVKSPYVRATALVTLEREGIQQAVVRSLGSADVLDIPITEAMLPNIYVGVALTQGRAPGRNYGPAGEDLAKPQARFGYTTLNVVPESRRLNVTAYSDKPDYRPGAPVKAGARVLDADGKPVASAEVALYAVDEGILHLTGYQTPDPFAFFYGGRPLWISTSDNRLLVIGMRNFGEKGQDRGGGGGEAPAPGMEGVDLRRHFESLAFWSADLRTDRDGRVDVRFTMPDNLTRFRLIAVAASGARFGSADTGLKVSKALVLRPSLPRFVRLGDRFQAGVAVQNATSVSGTMTVELASAGILGQTGNKAQTVTLGPGEARELRWDLEAGTLGQAVLGFKALGRLKTDESDGLEWKLPVEFPEKAEHAATSGAVDGPAVKEALARPSHALEKSANLDVELASTAMLGLRGGVGYLLDYPHLCLEQRLSRILPEVVGPDLLAAFHLSPAKEQSAAAQTMLDELPQFQSGSGGYRYWTDSQHPDPWLTAYALEVAAMARDSGFKLPKDSIARAVEWLRTHYDQPDDWAFPYSQDERDVLSAWALYSLSRFGVKLPGLYSQLYARREQLPLYSQADLLRSTALLGTPQEALELARLLVNQADVDARVMHFEEPHADRMPWVHASTVAVTGFCTDALLMTQGGFAGDDKAARWLVEARGKDGAWEDTQSNAWALMALTRYFRVHEKVVPDFRGTVSQGGKPLWDADFKGRSLVPRTKAIMEGELFGGGDETTLDLAKQGVGRMYYSLLLSWTPSVVDKPDFEGFDIERTYAGMDGKPVQGVLKAGQRYQVILTVDTNQDRSFVALTDFLPGGCEVVDTDLATESQAAPPAGDSNAAAEDPWGDFWGGFQRHEYYDDRVQVYADFLTAGKHTWKYTVQATTPGTFSLPSARVEMMYEPETYGRTAGGTVTVDLDQP